MFIGDSIGEEYKGWTPGDTVFISSQTGSGKTTFILNKLLPYARERNQKILYLVNRRVLKEQMEKEIDKLPFELKRIISVELYQTIENKFLNLEISGYELPMEDIYDWVKIRKYLRPRVINYEANKQRLNGLPHVCKLDLAVIFTVEVTNLLDIGDNGVVTVSNHLMESWECLWERAVMELLVLRLFLVQRF